ncbi:BCCT family transporter [Georgenia halophila]|uniref:BCCT family transporter n=1 Tax=Georgenia halophila TaxID=620889 RepID=A0ABP8L0K4_9MICO
MSSTAQRSAGPPADPPEAGRPRKKPLLQAPRIFIPALVIILGAVVIAYVWPETVSTTLDSFMLDVVAALGPWFVVTVAGFIIFSLWMGLSRFGDIKLGKDEDEPEFSLLSWFAMLFAAGMGIGLVFWGAAEPLEYFTNPKPGVPEGASAAVRAEAAISQTFLHWGFHAWAIYAVVGLAVAYAIHRKGRPVSIRWALEPLLGDRVKGWIGDVIDVVAVVGTLFGVATSLGLGVQQISAGLNYLNLIPEGQIADDGTISNTVLIVLITAITFIALFSVLTGIDKGIKILSNTNLGMAGVFLIALLLLGPTLFLLRDLVQGIGSYLQSIVELTFNTSAYTGEEGLSWQRFWTVFYWGWWISWAPFVGVFIARISKGRTVRQFIGGVLLVPTIITFVWFTVMGAGAIRRAWEDNNGGLWDPEIAATVGGQPERVLFSYLDGLPGATLLAVVAVLLVAIFFVTSSDSGSLVVDMLSSGGDINPPRWSRAMWALLEGAVAITLLLADGLTALRNAAILTSIPVSVVMVLMCVSIYKALSAEHLVLVQAERRQRREELQRRLSTHVEEQVDVTFDEKFDEKFDEAYAEVAAENGDGPDAGAAAGTRRGRSSRFGRFRRER